MNDATGVDVDGNKLTIQMMDGASVKLKAGTARFGNFTFYHVLLICVRYLHSDR